MCVCVYIYIYICLYKLFSKIEMPSVYFLYLKDKVWIKLKWGTILWIGIVGCLIPSPYVTKLPSLRFLIRDFLFTLINKSLQYV